MQFLISYFRQPAITQKSIPVRADFFERLVSNGIDLMHVDFLLIIFLLDR